MGHMRRGIMLPAWLCGLMVWEGGDKEEINQWKEIYNSLG